MTQKPLVLADDPLSNTTSQPIVQQLQPGNELDIPLDIRFQNLQTLFRRLLGELAEQGFRLSDELLTEIEV